jgi:hypothetical protein
LITYDTNIDNQVFTVNDNTIINYDTLTLLPAFGIYFCLVTTTKESFPTIFSPSGKISLTTYKFIGMTTCTTFSDSVTTTPPYSVYQERSSAISN